MRKLLMFVLSVLIVVSLLTLAHRAEAAEKYPVKPITFIVPAEAGSEGDMLARPVCKKASSILGQPIMIVNKPGGGGSIAVRELHDAKPDGYTIGAVYATIVANKLQGIVPYDHRDFSIVGSYFFVYPVVVASTKTQRPFKTIEEVFTFAKSHPGDVSLATSGVGYIWWILTMAFEKKSGLKFNIIPQTGTGILAGAQVAGGHTDLGVVSLGSLKAQVDSGLLHLLAAFGPKRLHGYGNIPTMKEFGYDAGVGSFGFVTGPPNMPKDIVERLDKAFEVAVNDPEYQQFSTERNSTPLYLGGEKAIRYLDEQKEIFRPIMKEAGILKESTK